MPRVLKSVSLNLLEPSGPVQACNGIAFFFLKNKAILDGVIINWHRLITSRLGYIFRKCHWMIQVFRDVTMLLLVNIKDVLKRPSVFMFRVLQCSPL